MNICIMGDNTNSQCVQMCLLLYTILFWLTGLALIFLSLLTLLDPRRNYILDLVDFSEDDPLLRGASYLALFTGSVTMIIGFIGYCGTIKKSLCLLITFVICLLVLFFADVIIACLALFYRNKFLTNDFDQKLQLLIKQNYGVNPNMEYNAKVTSLIDKLQFNEQCCGSVDYKEWSSSRWRTSFWTNVELLQQQPQFGFDVVPITCCVQLSGATPMNPVARSSARCQQFQANKLWRHQMQQCCGATGPHNYYDSFWYKTNTERGTISFVPQSCCKQMQEARAWFIKPIDPMCTSYNYHTSAFNSSVNIQGCHEKLLDWLTVQTVMFVSIGLSFAAFQLIGICIALSLTQRVHGFYYYVTALLEVKGHLIQEVSSDLSSIRKRDETQTMSDLLWINSRIENISRVPGRILRNDEICPEIKIIYLNILDAELKKYRIIAPEYHRRGDRKFLNQDYRGAYTDFLHAMKILGEHGDISDEFGRDIKLVRVYQDKCCICFWMLYRIGRYQNHLIKCFECYNQLIEKDPTNAFWYKRRATLQRDECHVYKLAYKGQFFSDFSSLFYQCHPSNLFQPMENCQCFMLLWPIYDSLKLSEYIYQCYPTILLDFALFAALMKEYHMIMTKEEVKDTIYCYRETAKAVWSLEKEKLETRKPFLTSDWINLWILYPCDDVLLEDLLSVHEEDNPENKSTLAESAYKDALKQTARGYHSLAVSTLLDAYIHGQEMYRSEAFLLLSLIYSQLHENEVEYYLDTFIDFWEVDQFKVPVHRWKQIFMRYMSLARTLLVSPLENLDLSMFTPKEQAQFYTQTALTVALRLQLLGGKDWMQKNVSNMTKLENIEKLCDRAIKADRQSLQSGMLREYTVMMISVIENASSDSVRNALLTMTEYLEANQRHFEADHHYSFASWCLFSGFFIVECIDEAIKYGTVLEKCLFFPGFVSSFLIEKKCPIKENIDTENVLKYINKVEERLSNDPENFRLYLNIAEFYYHLLVFFDFCFSYVNIMEEASLYANLAIKYWLAHIFQGRLEQLVRNAVVLETLAEVEKEVRGIKTFAEMEKHLQETSANDYVDSGVSDNISEIYEKKEPKNDEREEFNTETTAEEISDTLANIATSEMTDE
ncbi:tetraspanin family protein [Onchocerca flexuosa]|uniref:Tetraspanin family protein n=1 Tax=Onchocerca flexuosa TaxID=387005 RepID=A0A238BQD7_9BILA|nr:tetraspanin family protein [Onchocerca flexuosa]